MIEPAIPKEVYAPAVLDEDLALPRELYIEVTNRCNSLCATCPLTFDPQEAEHYLTFPEFQRLVDQVPELRRAVLHGIGEPLLNKELGQMVRYLKGRDVHVVFNSNAITLYPKRQADLVESGLDEIRISLDSSTPETYARMRGVNVLPKVLRNVGQLLDTRRRLGATTPKVSLWFTGTRENIRELPGLVEKAGELGADEVYLTRMVFFGEGIAVEGQSIYNTEEGLRREIDEIVRQAERRSEELGVAFRGTGAINPIEYISGPRAAERPWLGCRRPWRLGYVTARGNALPCCIAPFTGAPYDDMILGNVVEAGSLEAVWNGERYREFRRRHQSGDPPEACRRCGLDWSL